MKSQKTFFIPCLLFVCFTNKVFAQANTELSNLVSPTKINQNLLPEKDHKKNIGSGSKSWKDIYIDGYVFMDNTLVLGADSNSNVVAGKNAFSDLDTPPIFIFYSKGNSVFGDSAGTNSAFADYNAFMGFASGKRNLGGFANSFYGAYSGYSNDKTGESDGTGFGSINTCIGYSAGYFNVTGFSNTFVGAFSGKFTTESYNAFFGDETGLTNTTGTENTLLGSNSNVGSGALSRATAVGWNTVVNATDKMQLGASTTVLATSNGYTIVSDGRFKEDVEDKDVPGLDFITKLRPVTYSFNYKSYDDFLRQGTKNKIRDDRYQSIMLEKSKVRQTGFIAQEVDRVVRENGFTFTGVYTPQNDHDNYALDYSRFVVPLVKAVQQLSSENDSLKSQNTNLNDRITALESLFNSQMNNGAAKISIPNETLAPLLGQNLPNPFDNSTVIPFRIPKNCNSASIVISESATGKMVTAVPVSCNETNVMIDAGILASGTYIYSLYIDGKAIDTKQMTITR